MTIDVKEAKVATILEALKERENLDSGQIAKRCGVSYQTIKNIMDGGSPNARFITTFISEFGLRKEPELLRCLLISFLREQFDPREGTDLLIIAGLLKK